MSAPFGWTSSPAYYGVFGGAISWLVGRESPASMDLNSTDNVSFFAYEWVDYHAMVEPEIGNRLHVANETLRLAMLAVLGPTAINEEKFSGWGTKLQVLGLTFDTTERTISMPQDKIDKAVARVRALRDTQHTSKTELQQVLGSLRHVCSCLRVAKPFYQRLHAASVRAPRYGKISVAEPLLQDLRWFEIILTVGRLQDLPLAMYADITPIDVHLYMDTSNSGLVVLNPATRQYIQIQFDAEEQEMIGKATGSDVFNINVHEQPCVAYAAWVFGPSWVSTLSKPMLFVRAWSDNTSAVAWINCLTAPMLWPKKLTAPLDSQKLFLVFEFRVDIFLEHATPWQMLDLGHGHPPLIKLGLTCRLRGARSRSPPLYEKSTRPSRPAAILRIRLIIKNKIRKHMETMVCVVLFARTQRVVAPRAAATLTSTRSFRSSLLVLRSGHNGIDSIS